MLQPYFQNERVTIYHGDCLFILPELSGVGAVVTDPPYSSGGQFRGDRAKGTVSKYVQTGTAAYRPEFGGDSRDQRSFLAWCSLWMAGARMASEPSAIIQTFTDWRQLPVMTDCLQAGGWTWRGIATWWKPGIRMQRGQFSSSSEFIVHGTNGPSDRDYDGAQQNVIQCAPVQDKEHIAEKPDAVMRWLLKVITPGCMVLDPFAGSGATLLAAASMGHPSIGIEIDEANCEIAAKRFSQDLLPL